MSKDCNSLETFVFGTFQVEIRRTLMNEISTPLSACRAIHCPALTAGKTDNHAEQSRHGGSCIHRPGRVV